MRRKTALLAAVLAALLLPAPALAQTVSEGLIEVVGTLDLDALAAAAEDVPWLEGGVGADYHPACPAGRRRSPRTKPALADGRGGGRAAPERVAHHAPAGSCAAGGGGGADRRAGQGGRQSRALRGTDHDDGVSRRGPARARGLAEESVGRMSEMMQAIFPLMVTLLAAWAARPARLFISRR